LFGSNGFQIVDPEEFARRQQEMQELAQMQAMSFVNDIDRLIVELSAEHLGIVYQILGHLTEAPNAASQLNFIMGQMAWHLRKVHGRCTGCGDHVHNDPEGLLGGGHTISTAGEYRMVPATQAGDLAPESVNKLTKLFKDAVENIRLEMLGEVANMEKRSGKADA